MTTKFDNAEFAMPASPLSTHATVRRVRLGIVGNVATIATDIITIGGISALPWALAVWERNAADPLDKIWFKEAPVVSTMFIVLGICFICTLYMRGHYSRPMFHGAALRDLYGFSFYSALISLAVMLASDLPKAWRWLPLIWMLAPPVILAMRVTVNNLLRRIGLGPTRIVVVGGQGLQHLVGIFDEKRLNGYRIAGTLAAESLVAAAQRSGFPSRSSIHAELERVGAEFLIVSLHGCDAELRCAVLHILARETIPFAIASDFADAQLSGHDTHHYMSRPPMMLMFNDNLHYLIGRCLKGAFDRFVALIAIILLLPMLILVGLAVAADGGPVFFVHTRVGQNGRKFGCIKFRTMAVDSAQILARTLATDPAAAAEWHQTQKLQNDPRITRIGRILREASIDELPQILNVLKGDMSLVGPRPVVEAEILRYGKEADLYYRFRPGITGLWQVSGRSNTTYAQRIELDARYVKNWSLQHDLAILLKTLPALLRREGAV